MTSPQLPTFLKPTITVQTHAPLRRRIDSGNLALFLFFTAFFAVIIAHAG